MSNFMLSINPSLQNTGFTLWEKQEFFNKNDIKQKIIETKWVPIWINNYSFKKFNTGWEISKSDIYYNNNFSGLISDPIRKIIGYDFGSNKSKIDFLIYIESEFPKQNLNTTKKLDYLRGNIFGLFNKLFDKDKLISSTHWQNWYKFMILEENLIELDFPIYIKKWDKNYSLKIANYLIKKHSWYWFNTDNDMSIDIYDSDIADSLLIGWYVINFIFPEKKEKK